jgi:hypothetical protein
MKSRIFALQALAIVAGLTVPTRVAFAQGGATVVVAPAPVAYAPPAVEARPVRRDGVRLRGGFSFNGGGAFEIAGGNTTPGGAISFAARLGVQFNHFVGLYYQNTPNLFFIAGQDSLHVGVFDFNSVLVNLTLVDMIELGVGPSLDAGAVFGCSVADDVSCGGGSGVGFGMHGRFALNLGGLRGEGPRRSAFALGLDVHPIFMGNGAFLMSVTGGLGGEWY